MTACQRIIQVRGLCNNNSHQFLTTSAPVNYTSASYGFSSGSRPVTPSSVHSNSISVPSRDAYHSSVTVPPVPASVASVSAVVTNSTGSDNNYLNSNLNASITLRSNVAGSTFGSLTSPNATNNGNTLDASIPVCVPAMFAVASRTGTTSKSPSPTGRDKSRSPIYVSSNLGGTSVSRKLQPLQSNNLANNSNNSTAKSIPRPSFSAPNSAIKATSHLNHLSTGPVPPRRVESKQQDTSPVVNTTVNSTAAIPAVSDTVFTPISTIKEQLQQSSTTQNGLPIATGAQMLPPQFAKDKQKENVPKDNNLVPTAPSTPLPAAPQTPSATPNLNRKARRRSNLFPQLSSSKNKNLEEKCRNGELGSGRAIPLRQGYLHKKSYSSALNTKLSLKNKEWKKKYVTLTTDGCLTYHPSLHDYMGDTHGKKINLMHTTVKIPGQKPRGSCSVPQPLSASANLECVVDGVHFSGNGANSNMMSDGQHHSEIPIDGSLYSTKCSSCGFGLDERRLPSTNPALLKDKEKKKHRRVKSGSAPISISSRPLCERCTLEQSNAAAATGEEEEFVFVIVSLDNKQWHFQAASAEDRESWLQAIEQQILYSLQNMQSDKEKSRSNNAEQLDNERAALDRVRQVPGNTFCLECDAPSKILFH